MEKLTKIKRLEKHLVALNKSYENIIEILGSDLKKKMIKDPKDKDAEEIEVNAMTEDKIKVFMQGQVEGSISANELLKEIENKEKALADAKKEANPDKEKSEKTPEKEKSGTSNLSKHIN